MRPLIRNSRYGARMLLKKRGFTLIAVVTLALGVGANTALFGVFNAALPKTTAGSSSSPSDWPSYGRDLAGSHYNPDEQLITPATVARLKPKWVFETRGDVSSQPIVVDGIVFFGSWGGKEYAVEAKTGKKIWEFEAEGASRSGAAYGDGLLFFGTTKGWLYAADAGTGQQRWKARIDPHKDAVATSAPIYHRGRIYLGISSFEEFAMLINTNYACCTFRGSVVAYDAKSGREVWRFYTIPAPPTEQGKDAQGRQVFGPSGVAVWSTVAIHPEANRLYFTTGNEYTGPTGRLSDAIIALELNTGKVIWSHQATPGDKWTARCRRGGEECGPDFDFGTVPLSFRGANDRRLIGAGQKSGWFYALDPRDGKLVWKTEVGPGGKLGGILFGNATDSERVYVALATPGKGSVSALDGATGKLLWQTPTPDGGINWGPLTVTGRGGNRLVFAGSSRGFIRAYDAQNGKVLWEFDTGGAIGGGPTVVNGVLYIGSGYSRLGGKPNNKLYAFSLDGK